MTRSPFVLAIALLVASLGARPTVGQSPSAPSAGPERAAPPRGAAQDTVPSAVHEAASAGRYWRASRLLDRHLSAVRDTTPATILLAARLAAGWDDWDRVEALLARRAWLGEVGGGEGWRLLGRARRELGRSAEAAASFARYLELEPADALDRGAALLQRGLALAEADRPGEALPVFDRAAAVLPWFRDWAALLAAETAAGAGDTAAVRRGLAGAGDIGRTRAWRLRLQAAREAGDSMAAREVALETARSSGPVTAAAAWAELGVLRTAAGDTTRGRQALAEALEVPRARGAVTAARILMDLGPTTAQWRRIGDIYARHGNPRRAALAYRSYLESAPGSDDRARVRLGLGRALYNAGDYRAAERELLRLADEAPSSRIGAESLYLAARAQYRQGRSEDGQATLARLPERFPGQPAVTEGLFLLADLKHDDLEIEDARRYYRQAAAASPDLNEAGLALMRLGGLALLDGDHGAAAEVFDRYLELHPEGRRWQQATYWSARAHEALGRDSVATARLRELRRRDPVSFYGMRAAERLGEPLLDAELGTGPGATDRTRLVRGLRRVDLLAELGRRDDLVAEVERLRDAVAADRAEAYALAEALGTRGYTLTAISMGWDLYRETGSWDPRLLRIVYPFPFRDMVVREARDHDLDPHLVAGLIRRESAFNPSVSSGAGAIGLMQIMPETGRALAREVGLDDFEPALLKQPEVNLHLGTRYLAEMLERYGHSLPLVLSAYNAGPTRAEAWQEFPEARDDELLTERVPYAETRNYIRNVLLHRELYRQLYPDPDDTSGG